MSLKAYLRELFLEAGECTNSAFMIPPLSRDSYNNKGVFYPTEKLISKHYPQCFPYSSSTKVKEALDASLAHLLSQCQNNLALQNDIQALISGDFNQDDSLSYKLVTVLFG